MNSINTHLRFNFNLKEVYIEFNKPNPSLKNILNLWIRLTFVDIYSCEKIRLHEPQHKSIYLKKCLVIFPNQDYY